MLCSTMYQMHQGAKSREHAITLLAHQPLQAHHAFHTRLPLHHSHRHPHSSHGCPYYALASCGTCALLAFASAYLHAQSAHSIPAFASYHLTSPDIIPRILVFFGRYPHEEHPYH